MIKRLLNLSATGFCLVTLMSGCASTPQADHSTKTPELTDTSLDVLFATEFPATSEAEALAQAAQAMKEGAVDKALFFYVRALQFNPGNVELLAHIGELQMRRNNYTLAKRAFLTAQSHDATHPRTLEGLGLIYMSEGRDDLAVEELQAAVSHNDRLWRSHNALGVYADKVGDFAGAQEHYNAALAIKPSAAHILNNRGYSKFLAGDVEGAMQDFYEAANEQGFPQAWANLARVYAKQGRYVDAIETYREVMSEAHAFNNTGQAAMENGDFVEAERLLNEAIRLSPTYFPAAQENLSRLLSRR